MQGASVSPGNHPLLLSVQEQGSTWGGGRRRRALCQAGCPVLTGTPFPHLPLPHLLSTSRVNIWCVDGEDLCCACSVSHIHSWQAALHASSWQVLYEKPLKLDLKTDND